MNIEISPEAETRLTDEARRRGLSVDAMVEELITDYIPGLLVSPEGGIPELPVWHLGITGSLRRRDIYDDVD